MRSLDSLTDLMDMNLSKLQEIVKDRGANNIVFWEVRYNCFIIVC